MDVMRMAGLSVLAAVAALILRRMRPEMGMVLALAAGVMLLALALPVLGEVIGGIAALAQQGGVKDAYLTQLLKVAGVTLLTDFAAQTCRDAGESAIASKIELAGKAAIVIISLPVFTSLTEIVTSLINAY